MKIVTENKKAYHDYFVEEIYSCGIVLEGAEVKSVRNNNINLRDSFCSIYNGEMIIRNMHIAIFEKSGAFNTKDSKRDRKLLLRKQEIHKILGKVSTKGYTIVPLKVYFEGSLVKVEIGLCKGKHTFDKKECLKEKDLKRQIDREGY